jgi:hypothetical protein
MSSPMFGRPCCGWVCCGWAGCWALAAPSVQSSMKAASNDPMQFRAIDESGLFSMNYNIRPLTP